MRNALLRITGDFDSSMKYIFDDCNGIFSTRFLVLLLGEGFSYDRSIVLNSLSMPMMYLQESWKENWWEKERFDDCVDLSGILNDENKTEMRRRQDYVAKMIVSNTNVSDQFLHYLGKKISSATKKSDIRHVPYCCALPRRGLGRRLQVDCGFHQRRGEDHKHGPVAGEV
jgi:hypothetical protein